MIILFFTTKKNLLKLLALVYLLALELREITSQATLYEKLICVTYHLNKYEE